VYYLPGRGGSLLAGLGLFLSDRFGTLYGREVSGGLKGLSYDQQIEMIRYDLFKDHWRSDSQVVANSYGAYLLLHSLIHAERYPGTIMLLSPILGAVQTRDTYYRPPQAKKLLAAFEGSTFPVPHSLTCLVGEFDWQSMPERCKLLCDSAGGALEIVAGGGHTIEADIVADRISRVFSC